MSWFVQLASSFEFVNKGVSTQIQLHVFFLFICNTFCVDLLYLLTILSCYYPGVHTTSGQVIWIFGGILLTYRYLKIMSYLFLVAV